MRKRKSAEMSTTRGRVPACSAAASSLSIIVADTPCGAAENTAVAAFAVTYSTHLVVPGEAQVRQHRLQMTEELRDRLVGLAVGGDGRDVEVGVRGEQAQQLTGHVAGAAEHDRRDARAHSDAARASCAPSPRLSMM